MSTDDTNGAPTGSDSVKQRLAAYGERRRAQFERIRQRSSLVDKAVHVVFRPRYTLDTIASGYIALRIFVLLFPIAYIVVAGIGIYSKHSDASAETISEQNGLTGALADSIAAAAKSSQRGHFLAIIIGTFAALWAARGLLKALRISHAIAWRLPDAKYKVVDATPVFVVIGVFVVAWLGSVANHLRDTEHLPPGLPFIVHGSLIALIWFVAELSLPHADCAWPYLIPGAVLVGAGAAGLNIAVALYFAPKLHRTADTYGALGAGLVLITYLLAVGWLIVLSAELNAGIYESVTGTPEPDLRPILQEEIAQDSAD